MFDSLQVESSSTYMQKSRQRRFVVFSGEKESVIEARQPLAK
jgi:hypothetical protein